MGLGPFLLRPSTSSSSEMVRVAKKAAEACVTSRGVLENMRRVVCAGRNREHNMTIIDLEEIPHPVKTVSAMLPMMQGGRKRKR